MSDDQQRPDDRGAHGRKPDGGKPYRGKPGGGGKPYGKPYRGAPGERPVSGRPYAPRPDGDRPLDRPVTKFERRGLRHGHRIVDWRFEKYAL